MSDPKADDTGDRATEHDPLIGEVPDAETAAAPEAALHEAIVEQERQAGVPEDDEEVPE